MVVDFGRGNGFMAVNIGLFCGGLWVNGGVADIVRIPPLVADPHSLFSSSLLSTQAVGFAVFNVGFGFNDLWV